MPVESNCRYGIRFAFGIVVALSVGLLLDPCAEAAGFYAVLSFAAQTLLLLLMGGIAGAVWRPLRPGAVRAAVGTLGLAVAWNRDLLATFLRGGGGGDDPAWGLSVIALVLLLPMTWASLLLGYRLFELTSTRAARWSR